MNAAGYVLLIIATYFLGAVPWGVVLGKVFQHVDVRNFGSGGTGATNSLRVLGWRISIAVFALDFAKGLLPVLLFRWVGAPGWAIGAVAVASVAGHCWSPYIGFRGGKGMATGGGAAVALLPWLVLLLVPMVLIVLLTRYVSLASLIAALIGSVLVAVYATFGPFSWWWAFGVVAIAGIIILQHRGNIARLLNGTERKFGVKESATA